MTNTQFFPLLLHLCRSQGGRGAYVCGVHVCGECVCVCKGGLWQAVSVILGCLYVYLGAELCICDVCVCVCKGMV